MRRMLLVLLCSLTALAATDPWAKVRNLKTGTEVRIFKKGATRPVLATLDEANDENLIVVVKNEEIAINRDDIDRLDYRPRETPTPPSRQTTNTVTGPEGTRP